MDYATVLRYVELYPHSQFRLKLKQSIGTIRRVESVPEVLNNPYTGKVSTYYHNVEKKYTLDNIVVTIPAEYIKPMGLTVILQEPHYIKSSMNWQNIRYDNVESIEAMR